MTKKFREYVYRVIAGIVLVVAFVIIIVASATREPPENPTYTASIVVLASIRLEVADTDQARTRGLSGRDRLDDEAGMLFVFDEPGIYPFWMKEMKFPLDIIWINRGEVVDVVTLPPPAPGQIVPPRHVPLHVADRVLELNAGKAKELGLEPGVFVALNEKAPR